MEQQRHQTGEAESFCAAGKQKELIKIMTSVLMDFMVHLNYEN
jgi:hypothetical protein